MSTTTEKPGSLAGEVPETALQAAMHLASWLAWLERRYGRKDYWERTWYPSVLEPGVSLRYGGRMRLLHPLPLRDTDGKALGYVAVSDCYEVAAESPTLLALDEVSP